MKTRLILSNHAKQRMEENGLTYIGLMRMWGLSKEVKTPKGRKLYKSEKYGDEQKNVKYYWCNGYLFTVNMSRKVLITLTKQSLFDIKIK